MVKNPESLLRLLEFVIHQNLYNSHGSTPAPPLILGGHLSKTLNLGGGGGPKTLGGVCEQSW